MKATLWLWHNPSLCELRVYLDHQGVLKPPPSPFQQLLFELGMRATRTAVEGKVRVMASATAATT